MPKYGYLGPNPRKMKMFKKLFFYVKPLIITLPTREGSDPRETMRVRKWFENDSRPFWSKEVENIKYLTPSNKSDELDPLIVICSYEVSWVAFGTLSLNCRMHLNFDASNVRTCFCKKMYRRASERKPIVSINQATWRSNNDDDDHFPGNLLSTNKIDDVTLKTR